MVKKYGYFIPIYDRNLNVYIGKKMPDIISKIEKDYDVTIDTSSTTDGISTYIENPNLRKIHFIIALESTADIRYIAHESLHTAWDILDYLGIEVDSKNQEPLAYLMDYIIGNVENSLTRYKKNIKNGSSLKSNKKLR